MSDEKLERILKTYEPVEDLPGYVWFSKVNKTYIKIDTLRDAYREYLSKSGHELGGDSVENSDIDK